MATRKRINLPAGEPVKTVKTETTVVTESPSGSKLGRLAQFAVLAPLVGVISGWLTLQALELWAEVVSRF